MKHKALQKRRPAAERRRTTNPSFFTPEKFIAATPAHIHTDERAQAMAENFNARAFTFNDHIFFNKNEYNPSTYAGKKLLVHELAHVRQNRPAIARAPKPDPAAEARLKAEEQARIKNLNEGLSGNQLFWTDLKTFFPDDGRKIAGTTIQLSDSSDLLTTDFKEGTEQKGSVTITTSAPAITISKKYVAEKDPDKRKAAIAAELKKIDDWRFDTFRIDDKDVSNIDIMSNIDALDVTKKADYITQLQTKKVATTGMQEAIRRKMPSTPIAASATPTADGGFSYQFDNITINVLPDIFNDSSVEENSGDTAYRPVSGANYPGAPSYKYDGNNVITEITNPPQKVFPVWEVVTSYGPKTDPSGASSYGYGTRSQDTDTSLRFHEGSHGAAFVEYVRSGNMATPYPDYTGAVGDTLKDFTKKNKDFLAAIAAFQKMLEDATKLATSTVDCAGKSITQHHKEHGTTTKVKCR